MNQVRTRERDHSSASRADIVFTLTDLANGWLRCEPVCLPSELPDYLYFLELNSDPLQFEQDKASTFFSRLVRFREEKEEGMAQ